MQKILLVEDQENLSRTLKEYLEQQGYAVEVARDLSSAEAKLELRPDLMILDWMLPDGQGLDFLKTQRESKSTVPVIFLTARADVVDRVLGLEMGANDYMTKPFEPRELLARIRVQLRQRAEPSAEIIQAGELKIDRVKRKVEFRSRTVELVNKEFELLCLLAANPDRVFSRDEILNKVWGYDVFPTTRTVDTHILQIRQKTSDELIETVRAVGYKFKAL